MTDVSAANHTAAAGLDELFVPFAQTVREALHVLTAVSLGDDVDIATMHEQSLMAYSSLDAIENQLAALRARAAAADNLADDLREILKWAPRNDRDHTARLVASSLAAFDAATRSDT